MRILVLNSGSSSQKVFLYELGDSLPEDPPIPLWEGRIEWDDAHASVHVASNAGARSDITFEGASRKRATEKLLNQLWDGPARVVQAPSQIDIVGHRIVHGGREFEEPTLVTPAVKETIQRMSVFAPLHNPAGLEGIEIVEKLFGSTPQVAVFDTAFHSQMPKAAASYPGPYEWDAQGIRRYGFHGINHQYCAQRTARLLGRELQSLKLITCHLGNGCSLAAIRGGRSVDTTMGFTPLEGLMMGTRSGSIDPAILVYLMRKNQLTADQIDDLLNKKSGLLGISGISGDMRQIVSAMNAGNSRAKLAFDIFVHRLTSLIGSMAAVLGGLDALIFSAGIGENSADLRAAACASFEFLGARIDSVKNAQSPLDSDISSPSSTIRILIIRAQEDWAIARECWNLASKVRPP
jgi:acetate kinase